MTLQLLFPHQAQGETPLANLTAFLNNPVVGSVCADDMCDALNELAEFLNNAASKQNNPDIYREVQAICFWLRPASLKKLKQQYSERVGRGVCFQIAPSNVDTLFFYSMCCGLLSGNSVLIRVSETSGVIGEWLIAQIALFSQHAVSSAQLLSQRLRVVSYPRSHELTTLASSLCETRVIWGGNTSIQHIQQSPIKPNAIDVTFGHRYSMCVISLNSTEEAKTAAQRLVADCKPFHQQACASPLWLVWLRTSSDYQRVFWQEVERLGAEAAPWKASAIAAQDKLVYLQRLALSAEPLSVDINTTTYIDSAFAVLPVNQVTPAMLDWHPGQGCLLTTEITALEQLRTFEHCQTLATFGVAAETLKDIPHVRRICPLGTSLVFSSTWDGVDLIAACSKPSGEKS